MRSKDLRTGGVYAAKVSGEIRPVRIDGVSSLGGWTCTNMKTGRKVHVRGAARFRYELEEYTRELKDGRTVRAWRELVTPAPEPPRCASCGRDVDPKHAIHSHHTGAFYCWPGEGCATPAPAAEDLEHDVAAGFYELEAPCVAAAVAAGDDDERARTRDHTAGWMPCSVTISVFTPPTGNSRVCPFRIVTRFSGRSSVIQSLRPVKS